MVMIALFRKIPEETEGAVVGHIDTRLVEIPIIRQSQTEFRHPVRRWRINIKNILVVHGGGGDTQILSIGRSGAQRNDTPRNDRNTPAGMTITTRAKNSI